MDPCGLAGQEHFIVSKGDFASLIYELYTYIYIYIYNVFIIIICLTYLYILSFYIFTFYNYNTTAIGKLIFAGYVLHNLRVLNDDMDDHYLDMDDHYMDMDDHQNITVLCHRLNNSYHVIDVGL